jgi:AraC-like DNA-binding protein
MPGFSPESFQKEFFSRCPSASTVMTLFDSLPNVAFYAKDVQSRYVRVNAPWVSSHGVKTEAEMLGRDDRDFHPPAMAEAYIAEDRRVMVARKPIPSQVWLVFHSRRLPHWYVSTKVPLFDPNGNIMGIAGAMYGIEQPAEQQRHFQELLPVIRHIEGHFADNISMSKMASLAGLSSTHFNRRFQQLLRMTPTAYLRTVRIQTARRLLSTTTRTIAAISHDTGFTDQSHFTRFFRETTGLTPGDYRSRYQQRSE